MTILWENDWGVETLQWLIDQLQWMSDNLTSQLGDYNDSTLVGSQSITAINDRVGNYKKAIDQYTDLINNIKWTASEASRWSVMKQQAKQGYLTGLSTKRWQTAAETLKDMADVEATWNIERSNIRWQEMSNLWEAQWWLANLHMNIAEQQAAIDAASASRPSGGSSWWSTFNIEDYVEWSNDWWWMDDLRNEISQWGELSTIDISTPLY